MGTRCAIGYVDADNKARVSFCHWDGYIHNGVGQELNKRKYKHFLAVKELVGDTTLSSIIPTVERNKDFRTNSRFTVKQTFNKKELLEEIDKKHTWEWAYMYIFVAKEGKWYVSQGSTLTPLSAHFVEKSLDCSTYDCEDDIITDLLKDGAIDLEEASKAIDTSIYELSVADIVENYLKEGYKVKL